MGELNHLSKHFVARWELRVGGVPSLEAVRTIMRSAAHILHCKRLRDTAGCEVIQPAIYWHPDLDLVLLIDHIRETAISVMSKEAWLKKCKN